MSIFKMLPKTEFWTGVNTHPNSQKRKLIWIFEMIVPRLWCRLLVTLLFFRTVNKILPILSFWAFPSFSSFQSMCGREISYLEEYQIGWKNRIKATVFLFSLNPRTREHPITMMDKRFRTEKRKYFFIPELYSSRSEINHWMSWKIKMFSYTES